jgi:hypothetical protein
MARVLRRLFGSFDLELRFFVNGFWFSRSLSFEDSWMVDRDVMRERNIRMFILLVS